MESESSNKIDIQAEKSIFNEAILGSTSKVDMIAPTVNKMDLDFIPPENITPSMKLEAFGLKDTKPSFVTPDTSPFSRENMASLSESTDKTKFDFRAMQASSVEGYPTSFDINQPLTPTPASIFGNPAEFKPITPTEDPFEKAQQQTKNLEKLLNNQVMPNIAKIANEVNSLGVKEKNQRTMTEERPTIKPENLIFFDRSQKASSPPEWA